MKKLLFISLVSLLAITLNAASKSKAASPEAKIDVQIQPNRILNGVVFDKLTNESLAGAVVTANGQKVYTDLDGNFKIEQVCNGKCEIKISLISYEEQTIEVDTNNPKLIQIKLSQR